MLSATNPIEGVFATVRHRAVRTRGVLSQDTARPMAFKPIMAAAKTWCRLKGESPSPEVVQGITSTEGAGITEASERTAARSRRHSNPALLRFPLHSRCTLAMRLRWRRSSR